MMGNLILLTGSVAGTVVNDANCNKAIDAGEAGLAGWTVYIDANGNNAFDAGEISTVSNATGQYSIGGLLSGSYKVALVAPAGWAFTDYAATQVSVQIGQTTSGVNFLASQNGWVEGVAFHDVNGNGHYDAGESFLAGQTIYIDANGNNTFDAGERSVVTDAEGGYRMGGLTPGALGTPSTYTLRNVPPAGYYATINATYVTTVGPGAAPTQNFGIRTMPVANPGGPYTAPRGCAFGLNGTGSTQPDGSIATYEWGDYDGVTFRPVISGATVSYGLVGAYYPPTTTTQALRVKDNLGIYSAVVTTTLTTIDQSPTVSGFSKSIGTGCILRFTAADFSSAMTDPEGDPLRAIKLTTLPSHGRLWYHDYAAWQGSDILVTDIGQLTYFSYPGYTGPDSFTWNGSDDWGYAATGATVNLNVVAPTVVATGLTLSSSTVKEKLPAGTDVGTLTPTDGEVYGIFTYSLVAGTGSADNAAFTIDADQLKTKASFTYDTKKRYAIRVRMTDQDGRFLEQPLVVTVLPAANRAPVGLALSPATTAENQAAGTIVGTLSATDPNPADTFTYSFAGGAAVPDNARFTLSGATLKTNAAFNYEARKAYAIRVRVTDQAGLSFTRDLTVNVSNVNEIPASVSISAAAVAEGKPAGTVVGTLAARDPDVGDTFSYVLVSGTGSTDNAAFKITADGKLQTAQPFDFEAKRSYSIRVRATDQGGLFCEQPITLGVTNVNERPTSMALTPVTVLENKPSGTTVGAFSTLDPDAGNRFTYSLISGAGSADNAAFTIVGGSLRTTRAFNYESKASYSIRVRSKDQGGLFCDKVLTIAVGNVNERPTGLTLAPLSVVHNAAAGSVVAALSATDPDAGSTFTYALIDGIGSADNARFSILAGSNQLRVGSKSLLLAAGKSYSIRVRATDQGGLYYDKVIAIAVKP